MKFVPEDFYEMEIDYHDHPDYQSVADLANAKLEKWLAEAPTIWVNGEPESAISRKHKTEAVLFLIQYIDKLEAGLRLIRDSKEHTPEWCAEIATTALENE